MLTFPDDAGMAEFDPEQTWAASHWLPFFNHRAGRQETVRPDLILTCTHRSDFDCRMLPSESTPALLELTYGAQEIDLAECGPKNVGKIELAVGALP